MRLKIYLILVCIIVNSYLTNAQNNAMFPVKNFHITESHSERSIPDPFLFDSEEGSLFTRDSYIKNNKTYYSLYYNYYYHHISSSNGHTTSGYDQILIGGLSYDTLQNKVYLDDKLVYDFSLSEGDIYPVTTQHPFYDTSIRVVNIDTIIDPYNITRKVFYVGTRNSSNNCNFYSSQCAIIIEGIGNINGLLGPLVDCFEDCTNTLQCAKINTNSYDLYNDILAGTCSIINNQKLSSYFPDSNYFYNEGQSQRFNEFTPFDELNYTVYHKKDTILNNLTYQLLYLKYKTSFYAGPPPDIHGDIPIALLRNDKINKKVYIKRFGFNYWNFNIPKDTSEKLLFNFSLKVGDFYNPNAIQNVNIQDSMFVKRIDTIVDPDNIKRAVYIVDNKASNLIWKGVVIEGIGGRNGLLGSVFDVMDWSYQEEFNCYSNNGFDYQFNFFDSTATLQYAFNPCNVVTFVSTQDEYLSEINVYPNPAFNRINFNINEAVTHVNIYNHFGVLVKSEKLNENSVDIKEIVPGAYMMNIVSDKKIYSSRFIKID